MVHLFPLDSPLGESERQPRTFRVFALADARPRWVLSGPVFSDHTVSCRALGNLTTLGPVWLSGLLPHWVLSGPLASDHTGSCRALWPLTTLGPVWPFGLHTGFFLAHSSGRWSCWLGSCTVCTLTLISSITKHFHLLEI